MGGLARLDGKNLPIARRMLKEVTSILERRNIWYCLDGGTLLGIMREQRLLPWDNDMDLFVQLAKLNNTLRHIMGETLITHLGLDYDEE